MSALSSVLKEGQLWKSGGLLKKWKRVYARLCVDGLKYGKSPQSDFKLVTFKSNSLDPSIAKGGKFGFKISGKAGPKTFFCDSQKERDEWAAALSKAAAGAPGTEVSALTAAPAQSRPGSTTARDSSNEGKTDIGIVKVNKIDERYELTEQLGSGGFATVKVGIEKATGNKFAVKQITRKTVQENRVHIMQEIKIMRGLDHPNIVKLHDVLETNSDLYIVMELMRGGELFDRILAKGSYSEKDTSAVLRRVVSALHHMHSQRIAHCDLKPENLIYATPEGDAEIKLIDFGLSQFVDSPAAKNVTRIVGTPEYIAPEVVSRKGYSTSVDMWSMGVITYILLCGYYPFYGDSIQDIFQMVYKGKFEFPPEEWDRISESAKDLIRNLLIVDPAKRYTAEECLSHPWIKGTEAQDIALPDKNIQNLRAFNAKRRFRKGVLATIAMNKFAHNFSPRLSQQSGAASSVAAGTSSAQPSVGEKGAVGESSKPVENARSGTAAGSAPVNGTSTPPAPNPAAPVSSKPAPAPKLVDRDPVMARRQSSMGRVHVDVAALKLQ